MILESPGSVAFEIFSLPVYWYGIIVAFAVWVGFLCADIISKINEKIPKDFFTEISLPLIFWGLLGARLYYCLLNPDYYFQQPLEILDIRQGGLSIHGAIIFGILYICKAAKNSELKALSVLDISACATALAQSIGRWGNFFNSEAFGLPTNGNWGVHIPLANRPSAYMNYELFHPTFLYESILDFVIFIILLKYLNKKEGDGKVFFLYLILYSVVRICIECIRVDSALNIGNIPIATIVSVILALIGFIGLQFVGKKTN